MERMPTPEQPVYIIQLPVRIWHWSMFFAILVLIPTGYIIGKPWHSLDGNPTYLFYMGYTRMAHFIAGFVLLIGFLWRIGYAFIGNWFSRQIFVIPIWQKAWWKDLLGDIRWYLFLERSPAPHLGHNPLAQLGMGTCVTLIVLMVITGFGMFVQTSEVAVLQPFRAVINVVYWAGGDGQDLHSWHRLGMLLLMAFIIIHLYMVIREEIMGKTTLVSTMFNGYRYIRSGKAG